MDTLASIIGAVSGCISVLGVAYILGFWRGSVNSQLEYFEKCVSDYPPAEMWTMVKTLWDVYVMEALRHRPDLAEHGSRYKLKKEAMELIPDHMKVLLAHIPKNPSSQEDIVTGFLVVKHIGLDRIRQMAEEKNLSIQESIAILSTYLENSS